MELQISVQNQQCLIKVFKGLPNDFDLLYNN